MNVLTKQMHKFRELTYGCQREGIVREFGKVGYTLLDLKWVTSKDPLCNPASSAQCYVPACRGGKFAGEQTHVYVWLSPFTICLKLPQPC